MISDVLLRCILIKWKVVEQNGKVWFYDLVHHLFLPQSSMPQILCARFQDLLSNDFGCGSEKSIPTQQTVTAMDRPTRPIQQS